MAAVILADGVAEIAVRLGGACVSIHWCSSGGTPCWVIWPPISRFLPSSRPATHCARRPGPPQIRPAAAGNHHVRRQVTVPARLAAWPATGAGRGGEGEKGSGGGRAAAGGEAFDEMSSVHGKGGARKWFLLYRESQAPLLPRKVSKFSRMWWVENPGNFAKKEQRDDFLLRPVRPPLKYERRGGPK
jgi:hypothetical protein